MSASAQGMRVSAMVWEQWVQNVTPVVLDTVEQLLIRVFDQLGGRRLVRTAVTGSHTTTHICWSSEVLGQAVGESEVRCSDFYCTDSS